jgi:alginate O-acetyltransferase complex protein AlgI
MLFNSITFLFWFFPIVYVVNLFMKRKYSNAWLALASLVFYFWGESRYVYIFVFSVMLNFVFGLLMDKYKNRSYKKPIFVVGIVANLLLLGYYKYFNFLINGINHLIPMLNMELINNPSIHLPIGISFFTFEAIAYLTDTYLDKSQAIKNPIDLLLYMGIFPHLIAGPVIQYHDIEDQLKNRKINVDEVSYGLKRFIIGLSKKVLIANQVGQIADQVLNNLGDYNGANVLWIGLIAYTLQIYFDFSGYSDMAIGLGKMLGFTFIENFNYPYASKSIQEFWRRWNISLGSWFRNYVYIPLGGSKISVNRTYINLLIVFILTGIWHGAGYNFLIWGLISGVLIVLEKLFLTKLFYSAGRLVGDIISHLYLIFAILISWVFFRVEDFGSAIKLVKSLFSFRYQNLDNLFSNELIFWFFIGLLFAFPIVKNILIKERENQYIQLFLNLLLIFLFCINIMYIVSSNYNPFIYFRF